MCVCVLVRSDADVWRVQGGRMETKAKAAGRKNNRCVWWRGVGIGVGVDVCVCVCVCVLDARQGGGLDIAHVRVISIT